MMTKPRFKTDAGLAACNRFHNASNRCDSASTLRCGERSRNSDRTSLNRWRRACNVLSSAAASRFDKSSSLKNPRSICADGASSRKRDRA